MTTSTRKSLTDMATDASEDWREEVQKRDGKTVRLDERLAFSIGYLRGFKAGQAAKAVGKKK